VSAERDSAFDDELDFVGHVTHALEELVLVHFDRLEFGAHFDEELFASALEEIDVRHGPVEHVEADVIAQFGW